MTTHRLLLCSALTVLTALACSRGPDVAEGGALQTGSEALAAEHLDELELPGLAALALRTEVSPELRAEIVTRLRATGPVGLDALIDEYRSVAASLDTDAGDQAWRALIDEVARQRDAVYAGMFWRTDMQAALAEAEASGRPVLSLRLLGDLGSEYSCANSRMFRTLLYADPELGAWLEQNFVLHWSSERPVPRVEIDFGDGRVVERTITGNSAHFVLDARGRTIDVIPGLWSTASFRAALADSLALHAELAQTRSRRQWRMALAAHHDAALDRAAASLATALEQVRDDEAPDAGTVRAWLASPRSDGGRVPAVDAVPMAVAKAKIEAPILARGRRGLGGKAPSVVAPLVEPGPRDDAERLRLGARLTGEITLHPNTLAIIAAERPLEGLVPAAELAKAEAELLAVLRASVQEDTAKNALELYPRVHAELARRARDNRSLGFADVDEWLYGELFETPAEDPWLGLVDPAIYTGLERGGLERF